MRNDFWLRVIVIGAFALIMIVVISLVIAMKRDTANGLHGWAIWGFDPYVPYMNPMDTLNPDTPARSPQRQDPRLASGMGGPLSPLRPRAGLVLW